MVEAEEAVMAQERAEATVVSERAAVVLVAVVKAAGTSDGMQVDCSAQTNAAKFCTRGCG